MGAVREFQRSPQAARAEFSWLEEDEIFIEEVGFLDDRAKWIITDRGIYLLMPGAGVPARCYRF